MLTITIDDQQFLEEDQVFLIQQMKDVITYAFSLEQKDANNTFEVDVLLVDDEHIHEINRQYRNIDAPTDVISFAFDDTDDDINYDELPDIPRQLGEIIISVDKAKQQAIEYQHSFSRELTFLALHGFLHLLGYDHMTKEEEDIMFEKQDVIMQHFNITT